MRSYNPEHYIKHLQDRKGKKTLSGNPEVLHFQSDVIRDLLCKEPGILRCDNEGKPDASGQFLRLE